MVLEILKWFRSVKNQTHMSRISQSPSRFSSGWPISKKPEVIIQNLKWSRSVRVPLGFQVDAQSVRVPLGSQVPGSSVTGSRSLRVPLGSQGGGVKWNRKSISESPTRFSSGWGQVEPEVDQ